MKKTNWFKNLFRTGIASVFAMMVSCSPDQLFNNNFLLDVGVQQNSAEIQIAPEVSKFLVVKATNQTNYPAKIVVTVRRAQVDEYLTVLLAPTQTVGKLVENCDSTTNPVLSLFVPLLESGSDSSNQTPIPVGQVFVTVDGLPVLVPASELPGTLNVRQHFNCGDTVEFVVSTSFTDNNRFRVSALVFRSDVTQ